MTSKAERKLDTLTVMLSRARSGDHDAASILSDWYAERGKEIPHTYWRIAAEDLAWSQSIESPVFVTGHSRNSVNVDLSHLHSRTWRYLYHFQQLQGVGTIDRPILIVMLHDHICSENEDLHEHILHRFQMRVARLFFMPPVGEGWASTWKKIGGLKNLATHGDLHQAWSELTERLDHIGVRPRPDEITRRAEEIARERLPL